VRNDHASVRLDHRYPTNTCLIYSAPQPGTTVRIEDVSAAPGPYTPADDPTDAGAFPADTERATMGVTGRPCVPGAEAGDEVPGDVGCAAGAELTDRSGCGLHPDYRTPTPLGTYEVRLTWRLSTLCADTAFAPCRGVRPEPGRERPVRVTWSASTNYCVKVQGGEPGLYQVVGCAVE
jgi:hypothetical protein